jgi:uncharacterized protein YjbJ (UPF0337 family)
MTCAPAGTTGAENAMSNASNDSPNADSDNAVSMPSSDAMSGKWKQVIGHAKLTWGKLTNDELLKLEGHSEKLTGLVQERYALTRDAAAKQVKTFYDKHFS